MLGITNKALCCAVMHTSLLAVPVDLPCGGVHIINFTAQVLCM